MLKCVANTLGISESCAKCIIHSKNPENCCHGNGHSNGAMIGIIVGGLILLLLILWWAGVFGRR
jgi:hypothetical protein